MHVIQFLWKVVLRGFALFCLFLTSYLLIGQGLGRVGVNTDFVEDPNGVEIFVISNGIHTDIVVPAVSEQQDWTRLFDPATFQPPITDQTPAYISFGWGDQGLYRDVPTWDDLTVKILLTSMLLPTRSAVHVYYFMNRPVKSPNVVSLHISPDQYDILIAEMLSAVQLIDGKPQSLNCCYYPNFRDQFYLSPYRYHIFYTCNMWTNETLKEAKLPAALWATQPNYIMRHLQGYQ